MHGVFVVDSFFSFNQEREKVRIYLTFFASVLDIHFYVGSDFMIHKFIIKLEYQDVVWI